MKLFEVKLSELKQIYYEGVIKIQGWTEGLLNKNKIICIHLN